MVDGGEVYAELVVGGDLALGVALVDEGRPVLLFLSRNSVTSWSVPWSGEGGLARTRRSSAAWVMRAGTARATAGFMASSWASKRRWSSLSKFG